MKIKHSKIKLLIFILFIAALCVLAYVFMPKLLNLLGILVSVFLPFILGYGFSRLVNPLADLLQKKLKCPRGISAVLVIVLTVGIIGGALSVIIWKLVSEIRNLYDQFPLIYMDLQNLWQNISQKWSRVYDTMPEQVQSVLSEIGNDFSNKATGFLNSRSEPVVDYASRFAKAIPGGFIGAIIFILSVYFMVTDSENVSKTVHNLLGEKLSRRVSDVKDELKQYFGGYVKAQLIIMSIAFVIMLLEFGIMGIKYALLIAFVTAFLDALPVFGSGIVLWPLAIINFVSGNIKNGIVMVVAYLSIMLMRHLIEPKIVSSKIGINPILTLMSMYIGYRIWGVGGILIGVFILIILVSFYKAGIFDAPIRGIKRFWKILRIQAKTLKKYIIEIMEGNDE